MYMKCVRATWIDKKKKWEGRVMLATKDILNAVASKSAVSDYTCLVVGAHIL